MKKLFTFLSMLILCIGSMWGESVISTAVAGYGNLQSDLDVQKSGTTTSITVSGNAIITNASGVATLGGTQGTRTLATIALEINIPEDAPTSFTKIFTWSTGNEPISASIGIGIDTDGHFRGTWGGSNWNNSKNYSNLTFSGKHIFVITTDDSGTRTYVDDGSTYYTASGLMCGTKFTTVIIDSNYLPYISQIYAFDNTSINIATLINEMQFSTANVTADSNWGNLTFSPAFNDNARLNFIGDKTVTASSAASINYLTIAGTGNATLATSGENTMTATKSLLVRPTTIGSGINLGSFSYGTNGSLTVDATRNAVTYPADMVPSSRSKKITFNGSGTFGANISDNAFTNSPITGSWVFSGGSHSLYLDNNNGAAQKMGNGASVDNPTIYVKDGATLNLSGKDICGWNHTADADGIIRIDETSTLNFSNKSGSTLYFSQRLYLQPGSTVNINAEDNKFRMNGGTGESTAQIYMPDSETNSAGATISRSNSTGEIYLANDNQKGVGIYIGDNSTLDIAVPIDGQTNSIIKYGAGTLKLTSDHVSNTSFNVSAGTLIIRAGCENTAVVESGATLKLIVSNFQIAVGYDASAVTGEGDFQFIKEDGTVITEHVKGKVLEPGNNTWYAGDDNNTFNNAERWATGAVPSAGDDVNIYVSADTELPIDLTSDLALGAVRIIGTGSTLTFKLADAKTAKITASTLNVPSGFSVDIQSGLVSTELEGAGSVKVTTGKTTLSGTSSFTGTYNVASDATLAFAPTSATTVSGVISGDGAVEVASGVVTFGSNNTFTGGLTVRSSALAKTTAGKGFGSYTAQAEIDNLKTVTVENGGAIDIANTASNCYKYTIAGEGITETVNETERKSGAMFNSGSAIGIGDRQTTVITLSDDAMIRCDNGWGLVASGWGASQLNLNSHSLTKRGSADWILCNVSDDDTAGKIIIEEGNLKTQQITSDFSSYDAIFRSGGQLSAGIGITFRTIEAQDGSTVDFNSLVTTTTAKTTGTGRIQVSEYTANNTRTITTPIIGTAGNKGYIKKIGAGEVILNNASNTCGGIEVREGKLTFSNCAEKGISGTIDISAGAILKIGKSDAFDYDNNCTVNIYGTLDMDNARFSVGSNNIINAYAGCTIAGTGDGYGAIDNFGGATMYAKKNGENGGTVTWNANSRFRTNVTFNVEDGVTLNHTGNFMANGSNYFTVTKMGAGAFKFSGNNVGHRYKYSDGAFDVVTVENETETEQIHVKNSETMTVASGYALTYSRTTWIPVYGIAGGGTFTKTGSNATLSVNTPDDAGTEAGNFNVIESTTVNWDNGILSLRSPGNRTGNDNLNTTGYLKNATINMTGGTLEFVGKIGVKGNTTFSINNVTVPSNAKIYLSEADAQLILTTGCGITVESGAQNYYVISEPGSTLGTTIYTLTNDPIVVDDGSITVDVEITSDVVDLINTAIVNNNATSVDLTAATTTEITGLMIPDNCLVIVNDGTTVKDGNDEDIENNVVVKDGEDYSCENLVLTDKFPFKAPVEFTATSITHERTTSSTSAVWGTACLPYPVQSVSGEGDGIRYYQLSESNSNDGVMSFTLITEEIPANTPVVFIKSSGAEFNFNSTDKSVAITPANPESSEIQGMTLVGTFAGSDDVATDDSKNYYYISGNKFWRATGTLKVSPFRAYFTSSKGVQSARNFTLQVVDNGTITRINSVDGFDLSDEQVYTLDGKKVNNVKKGSMYIIGGNKVVIK